VLENQIYSTKLWTKDQYEFTYGKVEFRAKLPKGQGTWAACWMLGNDNNYGKWPLCGEIDILETTSEAAKITIPQSIHCKRFNGDSSSSGNKYKSTTVSTATSEYHTYGIEWTSQEIKFFIDGEFTWSYNPNKYVAVGDGHSNYEIWPYNKQAYLIINCAVGGTLGGTVGTDYWTKVSDKTYDSGAVNSIYQDYMYVDYVRVYQ
jgi:beta-glucanase (GH16 family)